MWRTTSDGTAAGTDRLASFCPNFPDTWPANILAVGDSLYLSADDGYDDQEIWMSGGSPLNTMAVTDLNSGNNTIAPRPIGAVNGKLLLGAYDSTHGYELWAQDLAFEPAFRSGAPPPAAIAGLSYRHQFVAVGGPSLTYTLTGGALPTGLTLSPAGLLSGKPTAPGSYPDITVTVSNGTSTAGQSFTISVTDATIRSLWLPLAAR